MGWYQESVLLQHTSLAVEQSITEGWGGRTVQAQAGVDGDLSVALSEVTGLGVIVMSEPVLTHPDPAFPNARAVYLGEEDMTGPDGKTVRRHLILMKPPANYLVALHEAAHINTQGGHDEAFFKAWFGLIARNFPQAAKRFSDALWASLKDSRYHTTVQEAFPWIDDALRVQIPDWAKALPEDIQREMGYLGAKEAVLLTDRRLWYRVHNENDRPFAPETATSRGLSPWTYGPTHDGYSAVSNPWHLWTYCIAMGWLQSGFVSHATVIAFSGDVIPGAGRLRNGEGDDGEALVMPDMAIVRKMGWGEFERELLDTPIPPSPFFGDAGGGNGRGSWTDLLGEGLMENAKRYGWADSPVLHHLLQTFSPVTAKKVPDDVITTKRCEECGARTKGFNRRRAVDGRLVCKACVRKLGPYVPGDRPSGGDRTATQEVIAHLVGDGTVTRTDLPPQSSPRDGQFYTRNGMALSEVAYVQHLAIALADQPSEMMELMAAENRSRRAMRREGFIRDDFPITRDEWRELQVDDPTMRQYADDAAFQAGYMAGMFSHIHVPDGPEAFGGFPAEHPMAGEQNFRVGYEYALRHRQKLLEGEQGPWATPTEKNRWRNSLPDPANTSTW